MVLGGPWGSLGSLLGIQQGTLEILGGHLAILGGPLGIPCRSLGDSLGVPWASLGAQMAQTAIGVINIEGSLKELGRDLEGLWVILGGPLWHPCEPKLLKM